MKSETGKVHCFPVRKVNIDGKWKKSPMTKGHWGKYQATDAEFVDQDNYGIVVPDGVVVIDLDIQKGVTRAAVDDALGVALDWDDALIQTTISGGEHYAFKIPTHSYLKQGNDLLGVEGFDTRCTARGWICAGDGYEDQTLCGLPDALAIEPWPELPAEALEILCEDFSVDEGADDLEIAVAANSKIEDLSIEDAKLYISKLPENDCNGYDTWLYVGFALYHQFDGSIDAFNLWDEFSQASNHYDLGELKDKWKNFGKSQHRNPKTFAYVIQRAGGRQVVKVDKFQKIQDLASAIEDIPQYEAFKSQVIKIPLKEIPLDLRGVLAQDVYNAYGKKAGLTKSKIEKAITPSNAAIRHGGSEEAPEWLENWVYVESACKFSNVELNYHIKKEAFDAKYNRKMECIAAQKSASNIALVEYNLKTVVDYFFWPGQGRIFEIDGKEMLNTYYPSGIPACRELDEDGQKVIDMFLSHLDYLIEDETEKRIILDWMTYVIQNPGKRVNWAILLQGGVGCGKSYLIQVLQWVLGNNAKNLDPNTLSERFTGWAQGSLVIAVEEIRMNGTNRFQVLDRIKPFITNSTVAIEEKGVDHRTVLNFTSYFMLTNYKDALPIIDGDRRYCVIFSKIQTEQDIYDALGGKDVAEYYFSELFLESERRADALAHYFENREISKDFAPNGRAPHTTSKIEMCNLTVSPERSMIEDAIAQHECKVINESVLDITHLNELVTAEGDPLPSARAISAILSEMNYRQIDGRRVKVTTDNTKRHHYIWIKGDVSSDSAKGIVRHFHKNKGEDDELYMDAPF